MRTGTLLLVSLSVKVSGKGPPSSVHLSTCSYLLHFIFIALPGTHTRTNMILEREKEIRIMSISGDLKRKVGVGKTKRRTTVLRSYKSDGKGRGIEPLNEKKV